MPNEAEQSDFDEVLKFFTEDEVVEIVGSVALFAYLNRWNDTMAMDLEDYSKLVAQKMIGSVGWDAGKHSG